jgi:predicted Zn finger-like uncharacterized protein
MGKKRPERTQKRERDRDLKKLVRATEKLAGISAGGSAERAIEVAASTQIEIRINSLSCPQCDGTYAVVDHRSAGQGMRPVDVKCNLCGVARTLWFKIVDAEPN